MTISYVDTHEAVEEGSPAGETALEVTAESRAHAREGTSRAAKTASAAVALREQAGLAVLRWLDWPGSLIYSQPPTFAQAHARHKQCAGHYSAALLRWPRLAWGWVHLLVLKPVLNALEWVTSSPATSAVAIALGVVIWLYGLGGPPCPRWNGALSPLLSRSRCSG